MNENALCALLLKCHVTVLSMGVEVVLHVRMPSSLKESLLQDGPAHVVGAQPALPHAKPCGVSDRRCDVLPTQEQSAGMGLCSCFSGCVVGAAPLLAHSMTQG
jgi:hypothetical protein